MRVVKVEDLLDSLGENVVANGDNNDYDHGYNVGLSVAACCACEKSFEIDSDQLTSEII